MRRQRLQARSFCLRLCALLHVARLTGELRFSGHKIIGNTAIAQMQQQRFVAADISGERLVAGGLTRLALQPINLRIHLFQHVFQALQIFLCTLETELGFMPARMQARDARRFLQNAASLLRLCGNDLADLALSHHRGRA